MHASDSRSRWQEKLHRTGFFLGALLLHLVVFLLIATYVVYQPPPRPLETPTVYIVREPKSTSPPPSHSSGEPTIDPTAGLSGTDVPVPIPGPADLHLSINGIEATENRNVAPPAPPTGIPHATGFSPERAKRIYDFILTTRPILEIRRHDPTCTFPIYVAAYAGGDWAYNSSLDKEGNIVAGSIPNLTAKINEWSHGAIKGVIVPRPLKIGGPDLLEKKPPFIFFTGHKDFVLTEDEVANLRDYLQDGGAIWGDNALAGKGSRFDIAFHREMKRVVPDHDFEAMPMDGDIYKSKFVIEQVPAGINYHAEPIEHLDIDGVLAILYTPNDYCDLYAMRILPGDVKIQLGWLDPKTQPPLTTSYVIQGHRNIFFRNFTLESSLAVHRLGMNIVTFFITRFDDKLLLGP